MSFFDLHIHSKYSCDSFNTIEGILQTAKEKNLSGIAIIDHESFTGSAEAIDKAKDYGILIVPGIEIETEYGDVIALFIRKEIKSREFLKIVKEVKDQGGLTALPHPFKRTNNIPDVVLENIDLIEAFNARGESIHRNNCNQRALELALKHNLPITSGSDAHFLFEIGRGKIDLGPCASLEQVKEALRSNIHKKFEGISSSKYVEVLSQFIKAYKMKKPKHYLSAIKRLLRTLTVRPSQ